MKAKKKKLVLAKAGNQKSDRRERYRPEFTAIAENVVGQYGYEAAKLAIVLGVSEPTVRAWADKRANFKEAVRIGSKRFTAAGGDLQKNKEVEAALLKRALGYKSIEERTKTDAKGVEYTSSIVEVEPDVKAQAFWLTNRNPERWKNKQEVNLEANIQGPKTLVVNLSSDADLGSISQVAVEKENDDSGTE